ncbi:helix-turn-helix domain-containing protein [Zoogloea sp.]|uniref:helix-turn-helix transcriptional regulator n=1 Tax=Zoogloea sp. TaxID=49181 RepID=UPI00261ADD33|nr:helix-turn-helix domain-containing protein [Zoogloea sp.]MDD3354631.1 helix-turn-helix domain-containing protein [Zoogloea sp.]
MQETMKNTAAPSLLSGEDRILTTLEVAEMLRLKPATLEKARSTGMGNYPPFVRLGGRRVGYRLSAVEAWIRANSFNVDGTRAYPQAA